MIDKARLHRLETARDGRSARATVAPVQVPHLVEFAASPAYLGIDPFPRQATLLKLIGCSPELLTPFDQEVLEEWRTGFHIVADKDGATRFHGSYGVPPDVAERMAWCHRNGRRWFREVVFVGGRRGSKSLLGAICLAYVAWNLLALDDPPKHFAIAPGKQLHIPIFSGQRDQARTNLFKDVHDLITRAQCFAPYVAKTTIDSLLLYSPAQLRQGSAAPGDAAVVISAKEATPLAGRGPATPAQAYDEMAHMAATGANRSAEEIFSAAHPALSQFGDFAFLYEASSPWTQQGQFFVNYRNGLTVDPMTGAPLSPDTLVVQLPSYDLYRDWGRAAEATLLAWPGGQPLTPRPGPLLDESSEARLRQVDPDRYDVEFGAQWATSLAAYLTAEHVDALFAPWQGQALSMQAHGTLEHRYFAHADPSVSGANFAIVIGHPTTDGSGTRHLVVDYVHTWRPSDFRGGRIDYQHITRQLQDLLTRFPLHSLTFDQFNSAGLIDKLREFARTDPRVLGHPSMSERTATSLRNQRMAETTKTALSLGLVHAPYHDLLDAELRHLEIRNNKVSHPTRGPVQTDDAADCLMNLAQLLLGDHNAYATTEALGTSRVTGSQPHPLAAVFNAVHRTNGPGQPRGYAAGAERGNRHLRRPHQ
jgi:hypothetical protein